MGVVREFLQCLKAVALVGGSITGLATKRHIKHKRFKPVLPQTVLCFMWLLVVLDSLAHAGFGVVGFGKITRAVVELEVLLL